jgi:hypothetical protein
MKKKFNSFKEFYPFYLKEHSDPVCRGLHFIGTGLLSLPIYWGITISLWYLFLIPVIGYGFAWAGHFFFEKNKPATFDNPWYSLAGDFVMFYHILTFQISSKLEEAKKIYPTSA